MYLELNDYTDSWGEFCSIFSLPDSQSAYIYDQQVNNKEKKRMLGT